jgi:hypothetical protein
MEPSMITPNDANACRGSDLHRDDQRHVLSAYVHRYTGQHVPEWATRAESDAQSLRALGLADIQPKPRAPVQFADDADWLANSWFAVKADGSLDKRHKACYSQPTWPNNPELRKTAA